MVYAVCVLSGCVVNFNINIPRNFLTLILTAEKIYITAYSNVTMGFPAVALYKRVVSLRPSVTTSDFSHYRLSDLQLAPCDRRVVLPDGEERISLTPLIESLKLDLMFMKHYAPNRCLYIKMAKLRTGVGSTETSYLHNCSVKLLKEHFKVQICKGRLFQKNKITFFSF